MKFMNLMVSAIRAKRCGTCLLASMSILATVAVVSYSKC